MVISLLIFICLGGTVYLSSCVDAQNATYPICYVCGGDPTATVNNPNVLFDIPPEYNSPVPQATCVQVFQAGLNFLIPVEACAAAVLAVDAQILCGCSNVVEPAPTPDFVLISVPIAVPVTIPVPAVVDVPLSTEVQNATYPICYVCGGDPTATLNNPNVLVDIPPEYNSPVPQATCAQVFQAGLSFLIPVEACAAVELAVDAQILCGCSNVVGPARTPYSVPIPASISVPITVPAPFVVDAPISTETAPPAMSTEPSVAAVPAYFSSEPPIAFRTETDPPVEAPITKTLPPSEIVMPYSFDPGVVAPTYDEGKRKGGKGKCEGKEKSEDVESQKGKRNGSVMKKGKKCKKTKVPKIRKMGEVKGGKVKGKGKRRR